MQATAKSAPRSPTSGVGIVWRVARAQGIPNDILVRTALALRFQPAVLSFFAPMTQVLRYCLAAAGGCGTASAECPALHLMCGASSLSQVVDAFDPNSSAAEADLRQGDILSRVDGVDVIGMPVPTVAEKIFGPVGSPVSSILACLFAFILVIWLSFCFATDLHACESDIRSPSLCSGAV